MPPPTILPARRQLAWSVLLDMPVRLTPPQDTRSGQACGVSLGQQESADDGTRPGWLVMLNVSNTGRSPIRCSDFTSPLSFSFPGRMVLAASLSARPAARKADWPAPEPAILIPGEAPDTASPLAGQSRTASSSPGTSFSAPPAATASPSSSPEPHPAPGRRSAWTPRCPEAKSPPTCRP